MRSRPGLLTLLLGLLLAVSGCTPFTTTVARGGAATTTTATDPIAPITWRDCTGEITPLIVGRPGADRPLTFSCGRTEVPISYRHPGTGTLPIFLLRAVLAGQANRIGSLVLNPGGPGASGADAAIGLALTMPVEVLQRFDLVGFDPRGVGLSTPVGCISAQLKDRVVAAEPRPTTPAQLDAVFGLARTVAGDCAKKYGDALGTFSTVATARDLDRIRQALGDEKLSYLGYSYGSTLGSTYAELFPRRVRALVLDGVVDPDADEQGAAEAAAAGLEKGFDAFAVTCTGLPAGCPVGPDPRADVQDLLAQAAQTPIPSAKPGETRAATPGVVLGAVQAALYDTDSWPQLAQALAAARQGDSSGLFSLADGYSGRLADGSYSNLLDANLAVHCADTDDTIGEAAIRGLAVTWGQEYPLFGAGSAAGLYTCQVWTAARTPLPERAAVETPPVLVVGNTGDPVTPYRGALDMARDLGNAVLVTWQGQGHTAYPKTSCVTAAVDHYLVDLTVPTPGLTCPATS